jgi:hypothetical protein
MKSYWTASAVDFSIFCGATSSVLSQARTWGKYFSVQEMKTISAVADAIIARTPDSANFGEIKTILWVCRKLLTMKQQV